ncbi:putative DNA-binding protein [Streptomyces sp. Tu6071]|nr:putative DNA-binding protein [Streptomyces sp. Tu6071]
MLQPHDVDGRFAALTEDVVRDALVHRERRFEREDLEGDAGTAGGFDEMRQLTEDEFTVARDAVQYRHVDDRAEAEVHVLVQTLLPLQAHPHEVVHPDRPVVRREDLPHVRLGLEQAGQDAGLEGAHLLRVRLQGQEVLEGVVEQRPLPRPPVPLVDLLRQPPNVIAVLLVLHADQIEERRQVEWPYSAFSVLDLADLGLAAFQGRGHVVDLQPGLQAEAAEFGA